MLKHCFHSLQLPFKVDQHGLNHSIKSASYLSSYSKDLDFISQSNCIIIAIKFQIINIRF